MEDFIKFLQDNKIPYKENESLKNYCTYKIGGIARVVVEPRDVKSLVKLIDYIKSNELKYFLMGKLVRWCMFAPLFFIWCSSLHRVCTLFE